MDSIKSEFPDFELDLIKEIEKVSTLKSFDAGEVIIQSGQFIQNTMLVLKGQIKIYREDDAGNEFFMYHLIPGQACAISMVCAAQSEASQIMAKVTEDAEILLIPLQSMEKWMGKYKSWYAFVVNTYRNRYEELLNVIDQVAFRKTDERLEFYLKKQAEVNNSHEILLSHQEIANELNTSREVVSRLLKKMEQRGKLKLQRNHIELI